MISSPSVLTVTACAAYVGVTPNAVIQAIGRGKLPATGHGHARRIAQADADAWRAKRRQDIATQYATLHPEEDTQ